MITNAQVATLDDLLTKALRRAEEFSQITRGEKNPQVVEMRHRAEGRASAYRSALDAIRGDLMMLRINASGILSEPEPVQTP